VLMASSNMVTQLSARSASGPSPRGVPSPMPVFWKMMRRSPPRPVKACFSPAINVLRCFLEILRHPPTHLPDLRHQPPPRSIPPPPPTHNALHSYVRRVSAVRRLREGKGARGR
jgi:hypothetical protein